MTTTVWRPHVRIQVRDVVVEVESKAEVPEEELLTKKGTKRKRAPPTKGPCEHGVKNRSQCKVCSACPHGRWRRHMQGVRWGINLRARPSCALECKECGGGSVCEHGRQRSQCKECGGASICEHGRRRSTVQGVRWGINMRARSSAQTVQGVRWVINMRARSSALSVQGVRWCRNLRARSSAQCMQGVRWCRNLQARSSALCLPGVRWGINLRARS